MLSQLFFASVLITPFKWNLTKEQLFLVDAIIQRVLTSSLYEAATHVIQMPFRSNIIFVYLIPRNPAAAGK